jgi:gliding motility-associated-like protein
MKQIPFYKTVCKLIVPLVLLACGILNHSNTFAQEQSPCNGHPFCSDSAYVFPNATSGSLPPTVTLGCLGSAPFPIWYYMQIGTAGPMQLTMVQTDAGGGQLDIDFSLFGPFTDLASGCAAILAGATPLQCSYSGSFTETIGLGLPGGTGSGASTPPAAVTGQFYIALLTNFSQQPGSISFSQTGGSGSADCAIVCGLSATNSGNVCLGNPVTLTGSNTDTTHTYTYYWSGPAGFSTSGKVVGYAATAPGTYTFNLIAVSNNNDTCHQSTVVTIFPKPNVALVDGSNKVLCNVGTATLAINTPTAGDSYQWYDNGVAMTNDTLPTLTVDTTGIYKVLAHNANSCADSSNPVSIILNFTHVDFNFAVSRACTDDTVRFTNLSEAGQYWWNYGDNTFPEDTLVNPTHIYDVQNIYTVRLKVRDLDGCVDSAIKVVDVEHPIHASFTQSADSICENAGIPVNFTNTSTGALTGYQWTFGDGAGTNTQNASHVYTVSGTKMIRLVVHDIIPCYDTATSIVRIDSVPFLSMDQDRHAICAGEHINFTSSYLQTATSLNWDFGDGTVWNQFGSTSHSYDNAGTYHIVLKGDYGVCGIATATDSVVVSAYPKVYLGPDTVLCLDGPAITVTDTANMNDPSVKWMWNTGATTASIQIVHPGTYSVTASRNDCATTENIDVNKDCYTDIPNGFTPNGDGVNDYFYPRQLLSKGVVGFTMTVYNRWGEKVFETTTTNGRGWDGKFNGKDQPMGVYIYKMTAIMQNGRNEEYTGNITLIR